MAVTYLDYNASSPVPKELVEEWLSLLRQGAANPSSLHQAGRQSRRILNEASELIASYLDCNPENIYWCSGASEANSWALYSSAQKAKKEGKRPRFLISPIEHDSILWAAQRAKDSSNAEVVFLRVTPDGQLDLENLELHLSSSSEPWDLVVSMHSNNETGVIQPASEISRVCEKYRAPLLLDCVQSLGRERVNLSELSFEYASFSGHKIGAPKGIGFLVAQNPQDLSPLIHGRQLRAKRGGTENPVAAAMLSRILRLHEKDGRAFSQKLAPLHKEFESKLKQRVPGTIIHGEGAKRLPNTSYVGFDGIAGQSVLMGLDLEGICASSGSACSSGTSEPSHVLQAMGSTENLARSSVRFSSGWNTTEEDFDRALEVLPKIVERVRQSS